MKALFTFACLSAVLLLADCPRAGASEASDEFPVGGLSHRELQRILDGRPPRVPDSFGGKAWIGSDDYQPQYGAGSASDGGRSVVQGQAEFNSAWQAAKRQEAERKLQWGVAAIVIGLLIGIIRCCAPGQGRTRRPSVHSSRATEDVAAWMQASDAGQERQSR